MHCKTLIPLRLLKKYCLITELSRLSILTFIIFLLSISVTYGDESDLEKKFKVPKLEIKLLNTLNVPIPDSVKVWKPFYTGGLQISLPVGFRTMQIHGSGEYGIIRSYEDDEIEIKTALIRLLFSYTFVTESQKLRLKPFLGVIDMMIHHNEGDVLESILNTEVFKNVENEYGIAFGVEPQIGLGRFSVALPIFYDLIFSSPQVYHSLNTSLSIGISF